jgi:hypothetical protein
MSGAVLAAGIIFGVGQRIGQWLVPAPPIEVALCMPGGSDDTNSDSDSANCVLLDTGFGEMPADAEQMLIPPTSRSL